MNEFINTSETKVLINHLRKELHLSNVRIKSELDRNIKLEKSLDMIYDALPTGKNINTNRIVGIQINHKKCSNCGVCISVCKQNVLTSSSNKGHQEIQVLNSESCIGCLLCMNVCKHNAIEVTRYQ